MVKKLFELIGDVFGIDSSSISDNTTQTDIDKWDSLNSLLLVNEIEKEYNVKFSIDEVIKVTKISDIKDILREHGVDVSNV